MRSWLFLPPQPPPITVIPKQNLTLNYNHKRINHWQWRKLALIHTPDPNWPMMGEFPRRLQPIFAVFHEIHRFSHKYCRHLLQCWASATWTDYSTKQNSWSHCNIHKIVKMKYLEPIFFQN